MMCQRGQCPLPVVAVTQANCEIAQPALVANATYRRAFGVAQELFFAPFKQFSQRRSVELMAWMKGLLGGRLGEFVPWANQLAVVTAKHPIAHRTAVLFGDTAFQFNRQVRDTLACVESIGANKPLA